MATAFLYSMLVHISKGLANVPQHMSNAGDCEKDKLGASADQHVTVVS